MFIFLFLEPETINKLSSCDEQNDFLRRARSLLVVVSSPPSVNYENFTEKVRKYTEADIPFHFILPDIFANQSYQKVIFYSFLDIFIYFFFFFLQFVSIYAAYLYDSVKLYARALDTLLKEVGDNLTEDQVFAIASNGTKIIQTIIKSRNYQSKYCA